MVTYYIGLAATLHDSALAILSPSGEVLFAEATERSLQNKRAYNCPPDDLVRIPPLIKEWCEPGAELVAAVSWSRPYLNQLNMMALSFQSNLNANYRKEDEANWPLPSPEALAIGLRNSISQAGLNLSSTWSISNPVTIRGYNHHLSHAAAAAFTSPFEECVVAVVDGYGEMCSTGFFHFKKGSLYPLGEKSKHIGLSGGETASLGFYYGRLCALCGFDPIKGEEWKVMGLAPYGKHDPELYALLKPFIRANGLGLESGCSYDETLRRLKQLRSLARLPGAPPLEVADLAFTGQQVFEEIMAELLNELYSYGLSDNLALAGGCALNSSWNGKIIASTGFKHLYVPSAPGDDGNAIGAAYLAWSEDHPGEFISQGFQTPYLGSSLVGNSFEHMQRFSGLEIDRDPHNLAERVSALLEEGKIIGWLQGRAEFGPRALGNRSILADPRPSDMKDRINDRVKFREDFRPFAPSILDEWGETYFEDYQTSPYMERTLRWRPEVAKHVPSVVHIDGTGRLQSVRREWNPRFYDLLQAFYQRTGVPVLLNTSFNVMDKPIAHSVEDALGTFYTTGLDALVMEDLLLQK
jgi:carbamoyltransferase